MGGLYASYTDAKAAVKKLQKSGFDRQKLSKEVAVNISLSLAPLISLIAGILILIVPRLLNYIVGIYLIIIGLLGLFGTHNIQIR